MENGGGQAPWFPGGEESLLQTMQDQMLYRPERRFILNNFWGMSTANAEGLDDRIRSIGRVSVRRIFRYLQIDMGLRRSPSARSEILKKRGTRPETAFVDAVNRRDLGWKAERIPSFLYKVSAHADAPSTDAGWRRVLGPFR